MDGSPTTRRSWPPSARPTVRSITRTRWRKSIEDQLLCADLVVLNKADLMARRTIERVIAEIQATIPRAVKIVETREGRIDPAVLLGLPPRWRTISRSGRRTTTWRMATITTTSRVSSLDLPPTADPAGLLARLAAVAETFAVLRMKGFIEVAGKPMRLLIQGVGQRFRQHFDRPWAPGEDRRSRLVVIGEKGLDRDAITASLQA